MNLDIKNYGHFRVTSHGGKRYDLFDRQRDIVLTIKKEDFDYINSQPTGHEKRCLDVLAWGKK